jgi:hypothetical protein
MLRPYNEKYETSERTAWACQRRKCDTSQRNKERPMLSTRHVTMGK